VKNLSHIALILTLTLISTLSAPTFAQETKKGFELPEGATARLGNGRIYDMQYTEDGTRLAVATSMGIWLYDTINYKEIYLISATPSLLAFSPDGNTLAGVNINGVIDLWDTDTGTHKRGIQIQYSERGRPISTKVLFNERVLLFSFRQDGQSLVTFRANGSVHLLDLNTGKDKLVFKELVDFETQNLSFDLDPENLLLAIGDGFANITVIDVVTGKTKHSFEGHESSILYLSFSPDGRTLASVGSADNIRLWDLETAEPKKIVEHSVFNRDITFSPDGSLFASTIAAYIRVWDVNTGKQRQLLKGHTASILNISFSSDLRTVASASMDGTVRIWDVNTGRQLHAFDNHFGNYTSFAMSTDGKTVVAPTSIRIVTTWDISSGKLVKTFNKDKYYGSRDTAFNPTNDIIAMVTDDNTISLLNPETGELIKLLTGHKNYITSLAFSTDGKTIVSGSADKTVRLWDTETFEEKRVLQGHEHVVLSVAFSPDGNTVASTSNDKTVRLWNAETGDIKNVLNGHEKAVWDVTFSPDGTIIASAANTDEIYLWDPATGGHIRTVYVELPGASCVDFSPDSKVLATGNLSGAIQLFDVNTGESLHRFTGHLKTVTDIDFTPDGNTLVSRCDEGILYVWNVGAVISSDP